MSVYNLAHLTLGNDYGQAAIQDDEALLLFAAIKCMRLRTVLEVGALHGYSAQNFLAAVGPSGEVISVDINAVTPLDMNHTTIQSAIQDVDTGLLPVLDLVFFDAHVYDEQLAFFERAREQGKITPRTVIALHDTGLFPGPVVPGCKQVTGGWMHEAVERRMVNYLVDAGYHALCANDDGGSPPRKGITLMQLFARFET